MLRQHCGTVGVTLARPRRAEGFWRARPPRASPSAQPGAIHGTPYRAFFGCGRWFHVRMTIAPRYVPSRRPIYTARVGEDAYTTNKSLPSQRNRSLACETAKRAERLRVSGDPRERFALAI